MAALRPARRSDERRPQRVAHYRNPMGLADTSHAEEGSDGMDCRFCPLGRGQRRGRRPGHVLADRVSTEKIQKLGVRTPRRLAMRLLGDGARQGAWSLTSAASCAICAEFEGYVERLCVNVTGQPWARASRCSRVYSPELVAAQRGYLRRECRHARHEGCACRGAGVAVSSCRRSGRSSLRHWELATRAVGRC